MLPGWTRIEIAGKAVELLVPTPKPRFAVLHLHTVGENMPSQNEIYTDAYTKAGLAVVAPYGARSWWTDRICPEFDPQLTAERHLLENVIPWIQAEWKLAPTHIAVFGISMGGQGALRLGFKYPDQFRVVGSVAGAFDFHEWYGLGTPIDAMYESREQCRLDTAILHLDTHHWPTQIRFVCDPDDEQWFRGNDRLHEKLSAFGVPHSVDLESTAGGHCWPYFDSMAKPMIQFLKQSLESESRRLL